MFLDAFMHLNKKLCQSTGMIVSLTVRQSVCRLSDKISKKRENLIKEAWLIHFIKALSFHSLISPLVRQSVG